MRVHLTLEDQTWEAPVWLRPLAAQHSAPGSGRLLPLVRRACARNSRRHARHQCCALTTRERVEAALCVS